MNSVINIKPSQTHGPVSGWSLLSLPLEWFIAQRRQDSFTSHAATDKTDHPDTLGL